MTDEDRQGEFRLNIGAEVHCPDGRCGTLERLVIDPRSDEITDLIVEKGFLLKEDRVIPVSKVAKATEDRIDLSVTEDDFEGFPVYDEKEFRAPEPASEDQEYVKDETAVWMQPYGRVAALVESSVVPRKTVEVREGVDVDLKVIGGGTPVRTKTQEIGQVDHVLVDLDAGDITHLVVEATGPASDYVIIDYAAVRYVDAEGIFVGLEESDLQDLPTYTPRGD